MGRVEIRHIAEIEGDHKVLDAARALTKQVVVQTEDPFSRRQLQAASSARVKMSVLPTLVRGLGLVMFLIDTASTRSSEISFCCGIRSFVNTASRSRISLSLVNSVVVS